jgi:hypothetical protein
MFSKSCSLFLLLIPLFGLSVICSSALERPPKDMDGSLLCESFAVSGEGVAVSLRRVFASLSRAERRIDKRSRCAAINERRSSPCTVGGMSVPALEASGGWVPEVVGGLEEVAALTADARRE